MRTVARRATARMAMAMDGPSQSHRFRQTRRVPEWRPVSD